MNPQNATPQTAQNDPLDQLMGPPQHQQASEADPLDQLMSQPAQAPAQQQQPGFLKGLYDSTVGPLVEQAHQRAADPNASSTALKTAALGPAASILDPNHPVWGILKGAVDQAKAAINHGLAMAKAEGQGVSALAHGDTAGATAASQTVNDEASLSAGHGVAAALPGIGPAAVKAGQDIGEGKTAYGAGEATGLIGSVLLPEVVKGAGKVVSTAVEPSTVELPGGEQMPVRSSKLADVVAGPERQDAFDRAVQNPAGRKGISNLAGEVADSGEIAKVVPPVEDPLGIRQASEAPKARAKAGFQAVDNATNNALSQAQQDALDASDDFTAEGKKSYREANAKVEQLINDNADRLPDGTTAESLKSDWRKFVNLQKVAKSFDTAYVPTPGEADAGYVNPTTLRAKIADLRQNGTLKAAGFSGNHIQTLDEIAVRMQQASERIRIGRVATALSADLGVHTIGTAATAKLAVPAMALRFLVGKALLNPNVAGTLLRGLKAGYAPSVIAGEVGRVVGTTGAATKAAPPSLNTVLADNSNQ